jgi:hypothetical protein
MLLAGSAGLLPETLDVLGDAIGATGRGKPGECAQSQRKRDENPERAFSRAHAGASCPCVEASGAVTVLACANARRYDRSSRQCIRSRDRQGRIMVKSIVVGTDGSDKATQAVTGAKRFLLGSVPNKVSHRLPCSVLIIRTA